MNHNDPNYIKPLRWHLQLVTPLVYDDALSLYETMMKVVKKLNECIDVVNPLGAGIEETVRQFMGKYKDEWEKELLDFEKGVNDTITANNNAVNKRIDDFTRDSAIRQDNFENNIKRQMADFNAEIMEKYATLVVSIEKMDEANRVWTLAKISEVYDKLTDNFPPVICPVDGEVESVQVALNHMWDAWRENALTADEYDALQLTATAYDSKELTATQYDRFGKVLLLPSANTIMVYGVPIKKQYISMEEI